MWLGGVGNTLIGADRIKHPRFNGPMSWTVFCFQFEAVSRHNNWAPWEKVTYLLANPQGQATGTLCTFPAEMIYEEIVKVPKGHYWDHQLAAVYHSQLKGGTQLPPAAVNCRH
jgi:hypothetical protein